MFFWKKFYQFKSSPGSVWGFHILTLRLVRPYILYLIVIIKIKFRITNTKWIGISLFTMSMDTFSNIYWPLGFSLLWSSVPDLLNIFLLCCLHFFLIFILQTSLLSALCAWNSLLFALCFHSLCGTFYGQTFLILMLSNLAIKFIELVLPLCHIYDVFS